MIKGLPINQTSVIFSFLFAIILNLIAQVNLQNLCPQNCTCHELSLDVFCKGSIGASGIPLTINPRTKQMVINFAQTTQLTGIDYLVKIEHIDLSNNKLTWIDFDQISKNTELFTLNLEHNLILELKDSATLATLLGNSFSPTASLEPAEPRFSKNLAKISVVNLTLSHNNLKTIRNFTFSRFHKLTYLNISYNSISSLEPSALFGLNRLEYLNLRGNSLLQIPVLPLKSTSQAIIPSTKISSLRRLDLSENAVSSIESESFSTLENLQELIIESSSVMYVHELAFRGLENLVYLSLDGNLLERIPAKSLKHLSFLRSLRISANTLSDIQNDSFSKLDSLEELCLNNGTFDKLKKHVFSGLRSLKRLQVTNNPKLTIIEPGTFELLDRLQHLDLRSNGLAFIHDDFGSRQPSLLTIDLRKNPLSCGCELKWLTKWLRKLQDDPKMGKRTPSWDMFNLTCHKPQALAGKAIIDLPSNRLDCMKPNLEFNVHFGFAVLFMIMFALTFICLYNFLQSKRGILVLLKNNLASNQMSAIVPRSDNFNFNSNPNDIKNEIQLYDEPIAVQYYPHNCT